VQTAEVMKRFEPVLESVQPKAVLVVGDVNSTIPARWWRPSAACA